MRSFNLGLLITLFFKSSISLACIGTLAGFDIPEAEMKKGLFPISVGHGSVSFYTLTNGARERTWVTCSSFDQNLVFDNSQGKHILGPETATPASSLNIKSEDGRVVGSIKVNNVTNTKRTIDPEITRTISLNSPDRPGNSLTIRCIQQANGGDARLAIEVTDKETKKTFSVREHTLPRSVAKGLTLGSAVSDPTRVKTEGGTYDLINACGSRLINSSGEGTGSSSATSK